MGTKDFSVGVFCSKAAPFPPGLARGSCSGLPQQADTSRSRTEFTDKSGRQMCLKPELEAGLFASLELGNSQVDALLVRLYTAVRCSLARGRGTAWSSLASAGG